MSFPTHRHCEATPKQSAAVRTFRGGRLLRRFRLLAMTAGERVGGLAMTAGNKGRSLAMTAGVATATLPGLALAHPGHDGALGHLHAWDIGLALLAAIAIGGIAYWGARGRARARKRNK